MKKETRMADSINLIFDEDGVARIYDDTYDITIHCESQEEHDKVWATMNRRWIPWNSGKPPEESGTYTVTAYDGATKRVTYAKYQKRLKRWELTGARAYWRVLAWMPLPEPYKGGEEHE